MINIGRNDDDVGLYINVLPILYLGGAILAMLIILFGIMSLIGFAEGANLYHTNVLDAHFSKYCDGLKFDKFITNSENITVYCTGGVPNEAIKDGVMMHVTYN